MWAMTEVEVDKKNRITIPKQLRRPLGIHPGSTLEAKREKNRLLLIPNLPTKNPTDRLWGLAAGIRDREPKKTARRAIATRAIPTTRKRTA